MKTASVRQLRTNFPQLESWLSEGESVLITKRKKIVAELFPPQLRKKKPDFARRFGGTPPPSRPGKSVVELLLEERGL
jgi:antitoxin (DNA-binding transcriptional repressor) of toxin-antitoxin stability system